MKTNNKKTTITQLILFFIFLFSFVLRVYEISEYPAGLNADEAAIGYNAYSLLQTGKDEFGHSWPLTFQSFNDFKPGLYFYLVLPFVKTFGLNEMSVRLPSVILGSLTVLLVYFLVKQLFENVTWGLISSLIIAVSPWHLHFSRGGWESNAAVFFMVLGIILFLKSLQKPKVLIVSEISFLLSMYTYHSARVVTPLLVIGMLIIYGKQLFIKKNIKTIILTFFVVLLFSLPLIKSLLGNEASSRFSGVGLFADQGPISRANEQRGQHADPYALTSKILHNKVIEYSLLFLNNYSKHFGGNFLFIFGDEIQRNKVPETGQMYTVEILFFSLGLYFLINKKPKNWQLLFWWLLISPIASALTFQSPHAIRSLNMVVPLTMITAYGIFNTFYCLRDKLLLKYCLYSFFIILYSWSFISYLHQYYVHYPQKYPAAWEYGFKELIAYVSENQSRFDKIYVTNKYDQPYILFAFYLKYPPEKFQKEAKLTPRDQYGFSTVDNFSKYYFRKIELNKLSTENHVMIIGSPEEVPDSVKIAKRIYFKDGKAEVFRIIEN